MKLFTAKNRPGGGGEQVLYFSFQKKPARHEKFAAAVLRG